MFSGSQVTTFIIAAVSGLVTAVVIETFRELFRRRKEREERVRERVSAIRHFMSANRADSSNVPPIARVLISSQGEKRRITPQLEVSARKISSVCEITFLSNQPNLNLLDRTNPTQELYDEFVFDKKPAVRAYPNRRFDLPLGDDGEYAEVWETRSRLELLARLTFVGRSHENDVVLTDPEVSRQHAAIRYEPEGYVLYDLTLTNPVCVNGKEIGYQCVLRNNDVIQIGRVLLEFQARNPC